MTSLKDLLNAQADDLQEREKRIYEYEAELLASRAALPKLKPLDEERKRWNDECKRVDVAAPKLLERLTMNGQRHFDSLHLEPVDLTRALVGISRTATYCQLMNTSFQRFGWMLRDDDFLNRITRAISRRVSWTLGTIQETMGQFGKVYHTEYHTVEMVLDVLSQLRLENESETESADLPAYERKCAALMLGPLVGLFHDYYQDKAPYENERFSGEELTKCFELDLRAIVCERGSDQCSNPACWMTESELSEFMQGMRYIFFNAIVGGTYLVNHKSPLKVVEHKLRHILLDEVGWDRMYSQSAKDMFFPNHRHKLFYEIDRLGHLLAHYDVMRYSDENISGLATKNLRSKFSTIISAGFLPVSSPSPSNPPLSIRLLDMSYRCGFHVLAGQSLRMMGELNSGFQNDATGSSYMQLFQDFRTLFDNLFLEEDAKDKVRQMASAGWTIMLKREGHLVPFKGPLYNIMIWHLKNDLSFVAKRDEKEELRCLAVDYPEQFSDKSIAKVMDSPGELVLEAYDDFYDRSKTEESFFEGAYYIKDSESLSPEQIEDKVWCGIIMLYLASHQEGYLVGASGLAEQIRLAGESIRIHNIEKPPMGEFSPPK